MLRYSPWLLALLVPAAWAQLDSSSAVLLRPSGKSVAPENLDSSRYKVRAPESKRDDEDLDEKPGGFIPSPVPAKASKPKAEKVETALGNSAGKATPVETVTPGTTAATHAAPTASAIPNLPENRPPVSAQVRDLFLGGSPEEIEDYHQKIHPQDPRANVLSISFAPAYFYQGSDSAYSYRRYHSSGPGFGAGMNLWLTPFFGVQSKYFSSVGSSVRSGAADQVPAEVNIFQAGIRFRKHFGYSRKAARLSWGVDYHDAKDKLSKDTSDNVGRRSSGLSLALEGEIPSSITYAHTFEVGIQPRLHHSEPATGVEVKSGAKNETNAVSLSLGGEWVLDRRNQIFWKTQYSVERNLFQGAASHIDPHNGQTPNGVSVTDSVVIFHFGLRWGS
ncbi:MAG: hypothetical protein KF799_03025 [Bdellovibrionales bacterium]|nr:hypothetical protein [Bdellovibrionales bacterium]